jgi:3-isopropylmalate dehydrogenase
MLLDWLAERHDRRNMADAAAGIRAGLEAALADPARRTPDLGGRAGTAAMARGIADSL